MRGAKESEARWVVQGRSSEDKRWQSAQVCSSEAQARHAHRWFAEVAGTEGTTVSGHTFTYWSFVRLVGPDGNVL